MNLWWVIPKLLTESYKSLRIMCTLKTIWYKDEERVRFPFLLTTFSNTLTISDTYNVSESINGLHKLIITCWRFSETKYRHQCVKTKEEKKVKKKKKTGKGENTFSDETKVFDLPIPSVSAEDRLTKLCILHKSNE